MDNNKTLQDLKNRKEESLRESTSNPMVNNPDQYNKNGKKYNSFTDYLNSDEYKEFLEIQEQALEQYTQKAKEYFDSLEMDNQLLLFFHITNTIHKNYFKDNSSYRGLLYDKFGFGPESYSLGMDSGMFDIHNSISTPDESEERFKTLVKHLKLNLSQKELNSLRNIFLFGFDNTKSLDNLNTGQKKFDF